MADLESSYTIKDYLMSLARNVTVDEATLTGILIRRGLEPTMAFSDALELVAARDIDLATADIYRWIALSPSTSGTVSDEDGDWKHSEGGEQMSATVLTRFLNMANEIYAKYGEETVTGTTSTWGMSCSGFHNIRNTGQRYGRR